ncbi:hypothetical protein FZEAL_177 [Fusarium zealandicum]|uniref:HMG box domain-containing protein n=1 Tax=Fusarium zealandicum TaxID=1053134 RepID=A0A8H4XQI8_9HYPO|nr:hypothetical protein FZEAL_177 [Fusarium zealandicum]
MTQVISLVTPSSQAITPARSPMDDEQHDRPPRAFRTIPNTPDSPSPRTAVLARKRAASINTADASYGRLEKLKLNTPTSMTSENSRDIICLCTPAPKIPRPRNAFILYRQHNQAQVAAQNPNLSNPDISKIIGEQWKDEAPDIKDNWKALADEEKQRHQRQYPDYRYQPRRGNKGQGNRPGSSPADENGRCPKCHGRSIATPRTPSTPFATPTAAKPPVNPYTSTVRGDDSEMARRVSYGNLPVARLRYPAQRPVYRDADDYEPESPEWKRRRADASGGYHVVTPPGQGGRALSMGAPPAGLRPYPITPMPEIGMTRSNSGPMPPPPRPAAAGPWPEHGHRITRHASYDESLRLPPLQTSVSMSPNVGAEVDIRQLTTPVTGLGIFNARDPQSRSIEAMVMSIPFPRKLSVLARINQPIAALGPGSPGVENRGAVIAVEGPKPRMLRQVGEVVEKALLATNEVALKTWGNLSDQAPKSNERRGSQSESPLELKDSFMSCFETMTRWHQGSRDIVKHIINQDDSTAEQDKDKDSDSQSSRRSSTEDAAGMEPRERAPAAKVPVALVKEGFSLTVSDAFACAIPIADSYAPIDHWQWMATLWRGIVTPDLVVYVKPSIEEDIVKYGTVEFQKRPGIILIRIAVGKDLDEATERRVAFEVVEWVRGGSFREQ